MDITLLGTGSPMVDPNRAGPSTLTRAGEQIFLVDCGRGVLMRAAAAGVGAAGITALLLTHLHSDHITDLSDVITTRWITTIGPNPLPIIGPPGTKQVVEATLAALAPDISYRIGHHADITEPPRLEVYEYTEGQVWDSAGVRITAAPTDHRPVEPTLAFRITHDGASVVLAGDTVPCETLDELARGADMLVHTVIRKDLVALMPAQPPVRLFDEPSPMSASHHLHHQPGALQASFGTRRQIPEGRPPLQHLAATHDDAACPTETPSDV